MELVETTLFNLIDQGFGAGILGAMFLLFTAGNAYLSLQRGSDRLWEDELPSKKVNAAWREQASRFLRNSCLLYTSPSPRDRQKSRMPSSA